MKAMVRILEELDASKTYSFADYLAWQFVDRVELLWGKLMKMSMPSVQHQDASGKIFVIFAKYLEHKKCKVFHPPFDVRLPKMNEIADNQIHTVVQPDIVVLCDLSKLDKKGCLGAPDLVIEILSNSTSRRDLKDKFYLYETAGVREYWIVEPNTGYVIQYQLGAESKYIQNGIFAKGDLMTSGVFPDLVVTISDIFDEELSNLG